MSGFGTSIEEYCNCPGGLSTEVDITQPKSSMVQQPKDFFRGPDPCHTNPLKMSGEKSHGKLRFSADCREHLEPEILHFFSWSPRKLEPRTCHCTSSLC